MPYVESDTIDITKRPIVTHGDWVALNPKKSGYFDDRDKSGLFLHQFAQDNDSHKGVVPHGRDISRIEQAVALGRLIVLNSPSDTPSTSSKEVISNRTRLYMQEQEDEITNVKNILHRYNELTLIKTILPEIKDKNVLEQLLQLEINGDNSSAQPRVAIVDYLTERIREYAKQITVINAATDEIVREEIVEEEGEKDIELADLPEGKSGKKQKRGRRGKALK